MVSKTIAKYGTFAGCKDLARCTVQVPDLESLVAFLEILVDCKEIKIVRIKNRFSPDYDSLPAGGYRDVQILLIFQVSSDAPWSLCELQINLKTMVEIKNGTSGGGGHDAVRYFYFIFVWCLWFYS